MDPEGQPSALPPTSSSHPASGHQPPSRIAVLAGVLLLLGLPVIGCVYYIVGPARTTSAAISITGADLSSDAPEVKERVEQFITLISPTPTLTPSPTVRPLPKGAQTYYVNSNNSSGPTIRQIDIDEFDPQPGRTQTITVLATDRQGGGIDAVAVTISDDEGQHVVAMRRSGTGKNGEVWSGTWTVTATHAYVYSALIKVTNASGSGMTELTFR